MGCSEETFLGHHQKGSAGKDVVGVSHYAAAVKNRIVTSRGLIKFDSSVLMVTQASAKGSLQGRLTSGSWEMMKRR